MSFFLFLLLVLLLMVGIPLLRGWLYMQGLRRKVNDIFGDGRQTQRQQQERRTPYEEEEYTETGERKIYTSGDGEYADYEEVTGPITQEATSTTAPNTIVEEQITDAEYEEIP